MSATPTLRTAEQVIAVVKQLPPAELRKFARRFTEWQQGSKETALVQATKAHLPSADERRFKRLMAKSERGTLTSKEIEEYRSLARQAEQLDVKRAGALVELARQRGKPVRIVMQEIGWESGENGASSDTSRRAATRT